MRCTEQSVDRLLPVAHLVPDRAAADPVTSATVLRAAGWMLHGLNTGQFLLGTCRRADRSLVLVATGARQPVTAARSHGADQPPLRGKLAAGLGEPSPVFPIAMKVTDC
jgi:hypothetical protein